MPYIHELSHWPKFIWDSEKIASLLGPVRNRQGKLMGRMEALGFPLRREALLQTLTLDVLKSSEIEGEVLNAEQVRSSIARRLGLNIAGLIPSDRHVDGVVEMMLDATQNYNKPLTKERLFSWHVSLFPGGFSGLHKIIIGDWRDDQKGPMQVVSGPLGHEKIHFEAPKAVRLEKEMKIFLHWMNKKIEIDPVLKSAIAHLWFVTLHPFEDGNGRIARAIADMQLARAEESSERFYSMSARIRKERKDYYNVLETIQRSPQSKKISGIDITTWMEWFLSCLNRALDSTESTLSNVLAKAHFWERHRPETMNDRQRKIIQKLLDGFEGKLTSSKWAQLTKCSQDTAHRDILELLEKKILVKDPAGGRSTRYALKPLK